MGVLPPSLATPMLDSSGNLQLLSRVDYAIVLAYLLLMVAIGFAVSRFNKNNSDFFRGGNLMPWWLAAVSLLMSTFSAYTFTGGASLAYRAPGVAFCVYLINGIGYVLGFLFLASRWRRSRSTTVFSYLKERYNLATNQVYSWTQMIAVFFQSGIMLLALSKFAAVAFGWEVDSMIILCGAVIAVYCLIGGLWAVVITDTLQFMVVFPAAIVIAVIAVNLLGGPAETFGKLSEQWNITVSGEYISGQPWSFQPSFIWASIVMMIFASSSGAAAQRYFSVKTEWDARKVALWVAVVLTIVPFIWLLPPFASRYLGMDADLVVIADALKMSAAEESTYVVFCIRYLPIGAMGVIIAAMLSATMSSISTTFNVYAAVISEDIIGQLFMKNASARTMLLVGRIVTLIEGGIVICLALLMSSHPGGVFQLMLQFSGIVIIPAGIPIFFGLIYKKTPQWAAIASYLTGLALGVVTMFILPDNFTFELFGIPLLSNPVTFEQQIFVFGSISALVYFLPGLILENRGRYRENLEQFFTKLRTPIQPEEIGDSELTDAGSFRVTGWTTVAMGAGVMLFALLPNLTSTERLINFSIGALMAIFGLCVFYLAILAKRERMRMQVKAHTRTTSTNAPS